MVAEALPAMHADAPSSVRGFTAIELLTVIAIAAILTSVAIPSFTGLIASNRAKAASNTLYLALTRTRSEAVKHNAAVTLSPASGGWAYGWEIRDASNTLLATGGAMKGITFTSSPTSVVYLSSGRIRASSAQQFSLTTSGGTVTQRCISITTSGLPYVKASAC